MSPLYDFYCKGCGHKAEDVFLRSWRDFDAPCPTCGREMAWRPFVNTQTTKADFKCDYSGKTHHSYRDLEKWAKQNNKTVVSTKDYEQRVMAMPKTTEELVARKPHKKLRGVIEKNLYKLRHGYDTRE